ncbi:uncharacterized protein LOC129918624 [Episyrphus balteatus]|uniref:uncharacterized protein LOC129918624 n=1 Tax=Episyrphus balteatus TaxID=286459 RepID=UPI002485B562|nr:uncharacterized protein LOC129918624 [Episyrphus balteatus]
MCKFLRIFILFTIIVGLVNCAKIKFGSEIQNGHWTSKHRISFPLTIDDEHYFFGLTDLTDGRYWFIQKLDENGKTLSETDTGTWLGIYTQVFPFAINGRQYIYGIDDDNYWFIQEILPGGKMGNDTANGYWKSKPTIIFPYSIGGKHYVYSLSGKDWFIKELLPNGKMGSETDHGTWNNYYTIGFPFSINGRQYFYCVSDNYYFIQELMPDGKIGSETANGHWTTNHKLVVPFSIDNKHYFYGVTDLSDNRYWFIQELLPGGKMGEEKLKGSWNNFYNVMFSFNINGRQFLYGVSEYYWFIQEILQDPRLPIALKKKLCQAPSNYHVIRSKRQSNDTNVNIYQAGFRGLNAVEEFVTDIEHDDTNYHTMTFSNPASPITSVSTFRVFADANHNSYIDLTAAMRAEIHPRHLLQVRDTISGEVYQHLREMDREVTDEAGHLLASSLGGSGVPENFAPQSPGLNRGAGGFSSGWHRVEAMLLRYLQRGLGYVRWSLLPQYDLLPNSRRPTAFGLSIRFYNNQGDLYNWNGDGAVIEYNFLNC